MIKTKLFTGYYTGEGVTRRFIEVDVEINQFLNTNDVELVDIKLTSASLGEELYHSALLIYKE